MSEYEEMIKFKENLFQNKEYDFIIFYNNRNIRRKNPGDIILGYKLWFDSLPPEKQKKVLLFFHTAVVDENGTDLAAVADAIAPHTNIYFHDRKIEPKLMNYLYNLVDVTINIASNEGFGLSSAESLMCGVPIINNVTGGLQDQMGFVDEKGKYLDPDKHFNAEWGSNHDGKYKKFGDWAYAVWPSNRALVGSPPTPYIFDDRCRWEDLPAAFDYWYNIPKEKRRELGLKGREYLLEVGMSAEEMGNRFIRGIDNVFEKWSPRKRFSIETVKQMPRNERTGIQLPK
jgi:glycosyltransferase involved in cell wall biosynthesis